MRTVAATITGIALSCPLGILWPGSAGAQAPTPAIADCTPTLVGTLVSRVHVRCATPVSGGVIFFAVRVGDAAFADRFLEVASDALVAQRTLVIQYDPSDTSGPTWGCPIVECRAAIGISMR
jgi:hypothetical protein